ncbi:MAG: DUF4376 domain-containing protein [Acidaminococcaceae bacterium]|nr:DUF4376 domain-containing protein [Acidaminococcaceae bacterium]MBQ5345855.1 DUF4376 domain-containing protein [Acidaminococcaceae bacterium]
MPENFLIKFDEITGDRLNTIPYDKDITPDQAQKLINDGYEIVSCADWSKIIGNYDGQIYVKDVKNGGYIVKPPYVPTLQESQQKKIDELKEVRNKKELDPIEYQGHLFDADKDSLDRLNYAIITLETSGKPDIEWTAADNSDVTMTAQALRGVIAAVGARSNLLHIRYRELKERVIGAQDNETVNAIVW